MSTKKITSSKKKLSAQENPKEQNQRDTKGRKRKTPPGPDMAATQQVTIIGKKLKVAQRDKREKLPLGPALKAYAEGRSLSDIGRQYGVYPSTVHQALAPYREQLDELKNYKGAKDTWQDMAAHKLLKAILDRNMEEEKLSSVGQCYQILNKAARDERGESGSTINIALVDLSKYAMRPQDVVCDRGKVIDIMADDEES